MKFGMARQQGWHGQSEAKPRHGEVRTVTSVRGEQGQGKGGVVERCARALGIAAARCNGRHCLWAAMGAHAFGMAEARHDGLVQHGGEAKLDGGGCVSRR